MSEDSNRHWTHGMDRTLWRNLGLFLFLSLDCAKWDNIRLTHYYTMTQLVTLIASVTGLSLN